MNVRHESLTVVKQWMLKADHDLQNAQHTLELKEDCPFDTVCFHAQQCVEKYLKAYLAFLGIDFPKTHDMMELIALVPPHQRLAISIEDLAELNPYAIETRYPGDWDPQSREDALHAVSLAKKIRETVRQQLPSNALQ